MDNFVYIQILGKKEMWRFQEWNVAAHWMAKVAQRRDATFLCFEEIPGGNGEIEEWPDAIIEAKNGQVNVISDVA